MPMSRPRSAHIRVSGAASRSLPSKRMAPPAHARRGGRRRITESAVIDLPEPDSPTRPITSPGCTSRVEMPRRIGDADRSATSQPLDSRQGSPTAPAQARGSSRSRRPSPSRLRPSTVRTIAKPGNQSQSRRDGHQRLRLVQHAAPARQRRLGAEPDIGQRRPRPGCRGRTGSSPARSAGWRCWAGCARS